MKSDIGYSKNELTLRVVSNTNSSLKYENSIVFNAHINVDISNDYNAYQFFDIESMNSV